MRSARAAMTGAINACAMNDAKSDIIKPTEVACLWCDHTTRQLCLGQVKAIHACDHTQTKPLGASNSMYRVHTSEVALQGSTLRTRRPRLGAIAMLVPTAVTQVMCSGSTGLGCYSQLLSLEGTTYIRPELRDGMLLQSMTVAAHVCSI